MKVNIDDIKCSRARGQAAMEYLMTYGWALLVIVLVLGALIYLQVLNPQARLQDSCNLPIGFKCDVASLNGNGMLELAITNQQAVQMEVALACATGTQTKDDDLKTALEQQGIQTETLSPGQSATLNCNLNQVSGSSFTGKNLGDMASGEVFVKYNDGTAADKYVKGTFTAKVSTI